MKRPYVRPDMGHRFGDLASLERERMKGSAPSDNYWLLQYLNEPLPTGYEPPRSCLQCGRDGRSGSFHDPD